MKYEWIISLSSLSSPMKKREPERVDESGRVILRWQDGTGNIREIRAHPPVQGSMAYWIMLFIEACARDAPRKKGHSYHANLRDCVASHLSFARWMAPEIPEGNP